MLVSPKSGGSVSLNNVNAEALPETVFLKLDGSLSNEVPVLSEQNIYVSKQDEGRVGKVETRNGLTTYYLKKWRGGRPGEILVDPYGLFSKPEDLSAFATQRGHRFCEYYKVNKDIFDRYVDYLQTRNPVFFKLCERRILNGDV